MKNSLAILSVSAALALAGSGQATEFVTNGDFTILSNGVGEISGNQYNTTTALGWSGNGGFNFVVAKANDGAPGGQYGTLTLWDKVNKQLADINTWDGRAAGAGNFVAADGAFETQAVSQLITGLSIGSNYVLHFSWAGAQQQGFTGATTENLTYSLGANAITTPTVNNLNHGFTGWHSVTHSFTATSETELLSFLAYGTPDGLPPFSLLSNVSLTGGVPEPTSWALTIVGIGGLGAVLRRRRFVLSI